jgi:hypothetical protein
MHSSKLKASISIVCRIKFRSLIMQNGIKHDSVNLIVLGRCWPNTWDISLVDQSYVWWHFVTESLESTLTFIFFIFLSLHVSDIPCLDVNRFYLTYLQTRFLQNFSSPFVCFILPLSKDALSPEKIVCSTITLEKQRIWSRRSWPV